MSITKTKNKNKDGLYQYRVRVSYQENDGSYKQKEKAVYGLRQAKESEYQLKQEKILPTKKMTVEQLAAEYFAMKKYEIRETSADTSKGRVARYILPNLGSVQIDKLTPKILSDWKISVEQRNLSYTTQKNAYGELRSILNYAVKMDYIASNSIYKVGNFKTGEIQEQVMQVYTPEDFKAYIAVAKTNADLKNYYDYYVFFNIAFFTGMRKGEIHALRWSNLDGDILKIKTSIAQKTKAAYSETQPKNKSSIRSLQLPTPLLRVLEEHKKRQLLQPNFTTEKYICGYDKPLSDTTIDNRNREFAKAANLPRNKNTRLSPHLRFNINRQQGYYNRNCKKARTHRYKRNPKHLRPLLP